MAEIRFDDVNKQNLISVLFSLEYFVDGIKKYSEDKFIKLHGTLVNQMKHLNQLCSGTGPCSVTHPRTVSNWCFTCSGWRTTILCYHKNRAGIGKTGADWSKIDSSKWPTDFKEMEKCFNPDWCNNMKGTNPNLDDVSVVIGKIINCDYVKQKFMKQGIFPDSVRIIRNNVHHNREIDNKEKEQYCDQLMNFLKCPKIWVYKDAQDAYDKIKIFKEKSYVRIIKDNIIKEQEMNEMKDRISASRGKCYTISILSVGVLALVIIVPLTILGIQEMMRSPHYAEVMFLLSRFFHQENQTPETLKCENLTLVTRREWGGRMPKHTQSMSIPIDFVFVHHTAGLHCYNVKECSATVRGLQDYQMNSLGWDDISYSFLIGEDGRVYEGRGWDKVGAHTKGWNDIALSFCFLGNFNDEPAHRSALDALKEALLCGMRLNKIHLDYKLYGHRDARPTDSPGHFVYNEIKHWDHFDRQKPVRT